MRLTKINRGALGALAMVAGLSACYSEQEGASSASLSGPAEWTSNTNRSALAASLRAAIGDQRARGRVHPGAARSLNVTRRDGRSYVDVIVTTTNTGAGFIQNARNTGLNVAAVQANANLVMGTVRIDALDALARVAGVQRIEPARPMTTLLDQSVPSGSSSISMNVTTGPESDGTGVVVGVVDTGIDYTHKDFRNLDGSTRILAIWDQTDCANLNPPTDSDGNNFGCGGATEATSDPTTYAPCGSVYTPAQIDCAIAAIEGGQDPLVACTGALANMAHQDTNSHGTHVASTAAGNGQGTGAPGVAPNADLIIVKFDFDNVCERNSSIAIIEGVRYIFEESGAQPASVNLSLGSDAGPHTGLTAEETGLSALVAPGKIAVFAAGNAARQDAAGACTDDASCGDVGAAGMPCGDAGLCSCGPENLCINSVFGYPMHGAGVITEGAASAFTVNVPAGYAVGPASENYLVFDLWYGQGTAASASVQVWAPGARKPISFSATTDTCRNAGRSGRVCVIHTDYDYWEIPAGSDNELWIQIDDGGGFAPKSGSWRVEITGQSIPGGTTNYDSWLLASRNFGQAYHRYYTSTVCTADSDCSAGTFCDGDEGFCARRADNEMTVGSPATAHDVLAVAAYTTRSTWTDFNGAAQGYGQLDSQVWYYGPMPTNDLAFFSSRGGTRLAGLNKPEIAAPGAGIEAAFSHWTFQAEEAAGGGYFYPGRIPNAGDSNSSGNGFNATAILQGTSMATPHATGGVAVLLQRNPTLTIDELRALLAGTASTAGGATNPDDWGAGRFDVDAALADMSCGSDADCNDGNICNGNETCDLGTGACLAGATTATGTPCDDADYCNGEETCDGDGACTGAPVDCDNGIYCDGAEVCDENTDSCTPGALVTCDDGNICNGTESCDEGAGACTPGIDADNTTSCSDSLWCNGTEVCNGVGSCGDAPDQCTGATETCNESSESCSSCSNAGDACSSSADCCGSLRCRGGRGGKTCKA